MFAVVYDLGPGKTSVDSVFLNPDTILLRRVMIYKISLFGMLRLLEGARQGHTEPSISMSWDKVWFSSRRRQFLVVR